MGVGRKSREAAYTMKRSLVPESRVIEAISIPGPSVLDKMTGMDKDGLARKRRCWIGIPPYAPPGKSDHSTTATT